MCECAIRCDPYPYSKGRYRQKSEKPNYSKNPEPNPTLGLILLKVTP